MLQAYQLLLNAARIFDAQRRTFSTLEIAKRINEIKYLSAQKKIPRLSLRKEIIHLEKHLSGLYETERMLLQQKKKESTQIQVLKKQIAALRQRLASTKEADLQKKLERLSFLLGDFLAKRGTKEDIQLGTKLLQQTRRSLVPFAEQEEAQQHLTEERLAHLQDKLEELKARLDSVKDSQQPERVAILEGMIKSVEEKIQQQQQHLAGDIKHELFLESFRPLEELSAEEEQQLQEELPIPPPPRMRK